MAKPMFQDIIPPERKSIKKIPLPGPRHEEPPQRPSPRPVRRERQPEPEQEYFRPDPASRPRPRRKASWKVPIVLIISCVIVGGALYIMSRSTGAKVVLTPTTQQILVDAQFTATKPADAAQEGAELHFQTVTISKDGKLPAKSSGDENVELKASGTIVIYNNYSTVPQKLIAGTRFQTTDGLIFRISEPLTVPGKNGETPGSIEAVITADEAGPKYNVGSKDFSIPGFKGDPRFTKIFGRSKVAVQGGFIGNRKKVDPAQVETSRKQIHTELKTNLVKQTEKDIPTGYVMPNNAYYVEFESLPNTQTQAGEVEINERATLHGIFFERLSLAKNIAAKAGGVAIQNVDLSGVENLTYTALSGTSTIPADAPKITFSLKGTTTLVSIIDADKLKLELVGKPRKNLTAILTGYPMVKKAEVTMRPFWKSAFPSDPNEITVVVASNENNDLVTSTETTKGE
jgi:hypothetical protein